VTPGTDRLAAALAERYTIERELGQGGMATVYLAQDLKHDRKVALKVLRPELAAVLGADRFVVEIKTTAGLQHPHILPLFDSGTADGFLYYVMPYIQGETLREKLDRERQLGIEEAVKLACAVADALDYAHRHGVIHRDIKPENILLHDGRPMVADFGIALAVSAAAGGRMTETGLSLGTPHYMSPEQATAEKDLTARSDVYSLASVLYEMLSGNPPHTGASAQQIIMKIVTEDAAPVTKLRKSVPSHVAAAVAKALETLPADRFGTAREFALALEGRGEVPLPLARVTSRPSRGAAAGTRAWQMATAGLLVVAIVAVGFAMRGRASARSAAEVAPVIRAHFDLPPGARVADALVGSTLAVSPAGDMIAFTSITVNGLRMYLRRVHELEAREIADGNLAGRNLTFSPDGKWLAFSEGNVLRKVAVDGGAAVTLSSTGGAVPYGLRWSATDTIYIGSFSGLHAVPASGGTPQPLSAPDSMSVRAGQRWPLLLPGDRAIVYARGSSSSAPGQLSVMELGTGRITDYSLQVSMPLGVLDDQLVYVAASGELMTVRIDVGSGRPLADPVVLEEGVLFDPTAGAKAALSRSGTLVLMRGRAQLQPVLVSRAGVAAPLLDEPRTYATPRYSPDGRRVALTVISAASTDVWIYDVGRNTFSRLTTKGSNVRPEWTPDGMHVVFVSDRGDRPAVWIESADGSDTARLLYQPAQEPFETVVSPDGRTLVFRTAPGFEYSRDILAVPYLGVDTGPSGVTPLVTSPNSETMPRFSPDGKWLAYQSNESGRFEIYVRPFPAAGGRVQVSPNGGSESIWGRDGRSLYFRGPLGEVVHVAVSTGDTFTIGARTTVLTGDYLQDSSHPNWDIAPDGRFLMLKRAGAEAQVVVVHGWGRELRAQVGRRR
jgi:serine/threonine-protein kinase